MPICSSGLSIDCVVEDDCREGQAQETLYKAMYTGMKQLWTRFQGSASKVAPAVSVAVPEPAEQPMAAASLSSALTQSCSLMQV